MPAPRRDRYRRLATAQAYARAILTVSALSTMIAVAAAQTMIRPPAAREPLGVVTHVDVLPDQMVPARDAVVRYVADVRAEPGALRVDAIQEVRQNHFDLVEVWRDEAAYRAHQASPATLRFRGLVTPWLGSPLDERIGAPVGPAGERLDNRR